jgi:hypothetical protein
MIEGFDYKNFAPARNKEFARTQLLRNQNKPETSEANSVSAASQKRRQNRSHNTSQRVSPPRSSAKSTTRKYRPHKHVTSL